jgi:hypothetical protein
MWYNSKGEKLWLLKNAVLADTEKLTLLTRRLCHYQPMERKALMKLKWPSVKIVSPGFVSDIRLKRKKNPDVILMNGKVVFNRFRPNETSGAEELMKANHQKPRYQTRLLKIGVGYAAKFPSLAEAWDACCDAVWFASLAEFHRGLRRYARSTIKKIKPEAGETKVEAIKRELGNPFREGWMEYKETASKVKSDGVVPVSQVAKVLGLTVGEVREAERRALAKVHTAAKDIISTYSVMPDPRYRLGGFVKQIFHETIRFAEVDAIPEEKNGSFDDYYSQDR